MYELKITTQTSNEQLIPPTNVANRKSNIILVRHLRRINSWRASRISRHVGFIRYIYRDRRKGLGAHRPCLSVALTWTWHVAGWRMCEVVICSAEIRARTRPPRRRSRRPRWWREVSTTGRSHRTPAEVRARDGEANSDKFARQTEEST